MKRFSLAGVNQSGEPVKLGKEVSEFVGHGNYFAVVPSKIDPTLVMLNTPKGSYTLKKHTTKNEFHGQCRGRKTHIALQQIVGEIRFW